jgi:prolyl oligopeptidase
MMARRRLQAFIIPLAVRPSAAFGVDIQRSSPRFRRAAARSAASDASLPTLTNYKSDPRVWLEDVEGEEALAWVKERNAHALATIGNPESEPIYKRVLDILDSNAKIPYVGRVLNELYYNFWQDEVHVRGIWRRCTLDEYRKAVPAWVTVLDLDALGTAEGVSWVWGGSTLLDEGSGTLKDRVIIALSRGGADATVAREFDLGTMQFISPSEGGFALPECKSQLCYKDRDTLLVGGAFGVEEETDSGYARTVREWTRHTPLSDAKLVYEGKRTDVAASGSAYLDRGEKYELRMRAITFYTSTHELKIGDDGPFQHVAIPEDANVGTFADQLVITLRSGWLGHAAGAMLAAPARAFMAAVDDNARRALLTSLFAPTESCSLEGSAETKTYLILSCLDNVVSEQRFWKYDGTRFTLERTFKGVMGVSPSVSAVDAQGSDAIWVTSAGYTQPTTLALADAAAPEAQEKLKALPAFFNAEGLRTEQHYATSADGTKIPYFLVSRADAPRDGSTPCLLYGYGGFEVSLTPSYSGGVGAAWLEKGYAYVQVSCLNRTSLFACLI